MDDQRHIVQPQNSKPNEEKMPTITSHRVSRVNPDKLFSSASPFNNLLQTCSLHFPRREQTKKKAATKEKKPKKTNYPTPTCQLKSLKRAENKKKSEIQGYIYSGWAENTQARKDRRKQSFALSAARAAQGN